MSGRRAKRLRRMARKAAREAGFTPENVWKTAFSNLRPKPRWLPVWFWWKVLSWLFYKVPEDRVKKSIEEGRKG